MARSTTSMKKKSYTRYSDAYRQEALALADRIGVAAAWEYTPVSSLCEEPEVKYAFIHRHRQAFSVQRMCRVVGVARSGYYAWRHREGVPSLRRSEQAILYQRVAEAFHQGKGRSGAPRLTLDLQDDGIPINRKTVAASLQRQGLRAKAARKFKAATNSSRFAAGGSESTRAKLHGLSSQSKAGGRYHLFGDGLGLALPSSPH